MFSNEFLKLNTFLDSKTALIAKFLRKQDLKSMKNNVSDHFVELGCKSVYY